MFAQMTDSLDFHSKALVLRAERQRLIASNIANADTPGFVARDLDFRAAMSDALAGNDGGTRRQTLAGASNTHARHIALGSAGSGAGAALAYAVQSQPAMDGNSVDLDRERASFVDNSVRYESTLRFINGQSKTILSAIQGQ